MFLNNIYYELGEIPGSLSELSPAINNVDNNLLMSLQEGGIEGFFKTEKSTIEMFERILQNYAHKYDVKADDIDAIFWATSYFDDGTFVKPDDVSRVLSRQGYFKVTSYGMYGAGCNNAHIALKQISSMMATGAVKNCLLVILERSPDSPHRIVEPGVSIQSDAAVIVSLSNHARDAAYRWCSTTLVFKHQLALIDGAKEFERLVTETSNAVGDLRKALEAHGQNVCEFDWVIPNNYSRWVSSSMAGLLGIKPTQLFLDNVGRFAHAHAADNFINLKDFQNSGHAPSAKKIALFGSGPTSWGLTVWDSIG